MNPVDLFPSSVDLVRLAPELILTIAATLLLVLEALTGDDRDKSFIGNLALGAIVLAMGGVVLAYQNPGSSFHGMLVSDGFAAFFRLVTLATGALTILCSMSYLTRVQHNVGEFYVLVLFSLAGQSLMAASTELIMLFIGLEISSISSYILAGFLRDDRRNTEASLKYFLLGSFATAFLLYGVAWIYGATGTTNLLGIREALAKGTTSPLFVTGAAGLMLAGFSFKVSAAPFQAWAPDVYQGAPAPVSGFLSAGPKAAAFAILLRIFSTSFEGFLGRIEPAIWAIALLTMLVGNFAALWQTNVKRLLGYSSIAHAGYVMVAVASHSVPGTAAAMFYLAAYGLMNYGAFAAITYVAGKEEQHVKIDDFRGLSQKQPVVAGLLTVFLLSLIGVPLTAGFFGKFYIFKAAIEQQFYWLAALGLLSSAVAAYYYLRIIFAMYLEDPKTTEHAEPLPTGIGLTMWITAGATLVLGIFPGLVLDYANQFAQLVR